MDYDFFDENNQPQAEEKDVQRVPAPPKMQNMPPKKRHVWARRILHVVVAVAVFVAGMQTMWSMLDPEIRTLVSIKKAIQDNYYKEVTDEDFYKAIFGGINEDVLDAYSGYMTPEEFASVLSQMEGNRIGIGLVFATQQADELRITRVSGNSPAEAAGIVAGERIVGCGKTETEITPCNTFEDFSNFLQDYDENEEFFLKLSRKGEERVVKLHKAAYIENYVFYRTNSSAYAFVGGNADQLTEKGSPMTYLDDDTAYIRLIEFTANAAAEFDLAMAQFKKDGKKNLILDLRENGGGYLETMQSIASYFCKTATATKPIVAVADYGERRESFKANGNYYNDYFTADSRIYVLADKYSASASECLIGCMLDYQATNYNDICLIERGGVAKTYGKGIMQETAYVNYFLRDAITLTTAEIRWPVSDNSIHGRGVLPEDGALTSQENIDFEIETENAIKKLLG